MGVRRLWQTLALLVITPFSGRNGGGTMGIREIVYISSSVWLGISTMLLSVFRDAKDTGTRGRAVAIWIMVTGYMVFRYFVR